MDVIKRYRAAEMEVQRLVPPSLWEVDPQLIFDYLVFANRPEGASGLEVQDELGIDRNHQTRLTQRLVDAEWLVRISRTGSDKRSHFVRTSPLAMGKKSELESALRTTMRPVSVPRTAPLARGQRSIFDIESSDSED
jgi:hypothetical protein